MKEIYIIGAGGHGVVVAELAVASGYEVIGFADDDPCRLGERILHWSIIGGRDCIPDGAAVALGIGNNAARAALLVEAEKHNWQLPTLIHPSAIISPSATLAPGVVALAQVAVNARAHIGPAALLNTACSVDHDCVIGTAAHIAPGTRLAGNITVGDGAFLGIGSCVRPGIKIGARAIIGAGSVVISNIPDNVTAYGNPARVRNTGLKEI